MAKQFIVRLKKTDGTIVANSQVITVNGIGDGAILSSDFVDGTLTGSVTTTNRAGQFCKVIAAPAPSPTPTPTPTRSAVAITPTPTPTRTAPGITPTPTPTPTPSPAAPGVLSGFFGIDSAPTSGQLTLISPGYYAVNEGSQFVISLSARGSGTSLNMTVPYTITGSGLTADDIDPDGSNSGNFTLSTSSNGYFVGTKTFTAVADLTTEGNEPTQISVSSGIPQGVVNALLFRIDDTSTAPGVTPTPTPTPTRSPAPSGTAGLCARIYFGRNVGVGMNGTYSWSIYSTDLANSGLGLMQIENIYSPFQVTTTTGNPLKIDYSITDPNLYWPANQFYTIIYTGKFVPTVSGSYTFTATVDDFFLLWVGANANANNATVNNVLVKTKLNEGTQSGSINLTAGQSYPLRAQYTNGQSTRTLNLTVTPPGGSATSDLSPYLFYDSCAALSWPGPSSIVAFGQMQIWNTTDNVPITVFRRLAMNSVRGITRIQVYGKCDPATSGATSVSGITYDSIGGTEELVYDTETTGVTFGYLDSKGGSQSDGPYTLRQDGAMAFLTVTDNQGYPKFIGYYSTSLGNYSLENRGWFYNHSQEKNFPIGNVVTGYRIKIYTTTSPYPTPAFVTSSSSTPVTDYVFLGGTNPGENFGPPGEI